jgi:hypothetical protein
MSDAKTLDMTDEQCRLMEDMLVALQPLQLLTVLFSQEHSPSASIVYPSLWKLVIDGMASKTEDSSTIAGFKSAIISSVKERFHMTSIETAKHPLSSAQYMIPSKKV